MFKKLFALLLAVCFVLGLSACNGKEQEKTPGEKTPVKVVDSKIKDGKPAPVGDVYDAPQFEATAGAPIIGQITPQANPDDSVMIAGEGFKSSGLKAYVYAQSTKDNGKAVEAKYTVIDDQKMQVVIDKSLDYGIYGVYLENASGKGNVAYVNKPDIWYLSYTQRTAGEELDIFGENLTTDNKTDTSVFFVSEESNKYCEATIIYSDSFKITVQVPDTLEINGEYSVYVHNGHGGNEGFAIADEKVKIAETTAVAYNGNIIDVTEFGADPKDNTNDDTKAIQDALDSAQFGDIIYFPKGAYMCYKTVNVEVGVRICGDGQKNTVVICGNGVKGSMFNVTAGPVQFVNLGFWHKRTTGSLTANLILSHHVTVAPNEYSLKVNNCQFIQSVEADYRSLKHAVYAQDADGVIVENNYFDAVGIIGTYSCDRVAFRNNKAYAGMYVGKYYHQNATFFVNTDKLDYCNNVLQGKDILDDPTGMLKSNNWTSGRSIAVQGYGSNFYICNNTFERTGLPDDNAGEQIMLENMTARYDGSIGSADANTITMPSGVGFQASKGDVVTITSGKGQSQYRVITKVSKATITLSEPWGVIPDSTSKILITNGFRDLAINKNKFDGYANYLQNPGATTGIQVYGNTHNLYYTNNDIKNVPEGICIQPYYMTAENSMSRAFIGWNMFDGNKIENCGEGIRFIYTTDKQDAPFESSYANVFRRTSIKTIENYLATSGWDDMGGKGFKLGVYDNRNSGAKWNDNGFNGALLEHVTFEGCQDVDIRLYEMQGNLIIRDCKSDKGDLSIKVSTGAQEPIIVK